MAESYATVSEYRAETGDERSTDAAVAARLAQQSAKLRAKARIAEGRALTEDQRTLCHDLVVDACRKALVPPTLEGFGSTLSGATSASFSANGFQQSVQLSNPSGAAYFDRDTLAALMASLGTGQRMGTVRLGVGW
ncbi:hypothetical protein ACTQ1D_01565 [Parafannyhessea umbonata]|uniref:hypothetical protein n=1 Tax=Parafannyhessea umbonata TaxID=604330 RepID=UPI003F96D1E1